MNDYFEEVEVWDVMFTYDAPHQFETVVDEWLTFMQDKYQVYFIERRTNSGRKEKPLMAIRFACHRSRIHNVMKDTEELMNVGSVIAYRVSSHGIVLNSSDDD